MKELCRKNCEKVLQSVFKFVTMYTRKKKGEFCMTYEQAKALLEEKGQAHLLKYYDELDEAGKRIF